MKVIERLLYGAHKAIVVVVVATSAMLASAIPALAAGDTNAWTTGNCDGTADLKSAFQGLTSTVWGWGMIALIAITVIALIGLPFTALAKRKDGMHTILMFLALVLVVELLGSAIIGLMVAKATCAA